MKRLVIILVLGLLCLQFSNAQQFRQTSPYSSRTDNRLPKPAPGEVLPEVPLIKISNINTAEEKLALDSCEECRIARGIYNSVDIDYFEHALRTKSSDGAEIFQLKIELTTAFAGEFIFDDIVLSEKAELYIIDEAGNSIGGVTKKNLDGNHYSTFPATGSEFLIELYDPYGQSNLMKLHISDVVHFFEPISKSNIEDQTPDFYNLFLSCLNENDINDPQWSAYSEYKKAVGMMISEITPSNGKRYQAVCSGALINNTREDGKPYFLTARHCVSNTHKNSNGPRFSQDGSIPVIEFPKTTFLFNYEEGQNQYYYYNGARLLTMGQESDYALLELHHKPQNFGDVYYLGWNRTMNADDISHVAGIHHPGGIKKIISTSSSPLGLYQDPISINGDVYLQGSIETTTQMWLVHWNHNNTAIGSSGSPLLKDNTDQIIGTVCCGQSACEYGAHNHTSMGPTLPDAYGIFGYSWDHPIAAGYIGGGLLFKYPPLKDFLDPLDKDDMIFGGYNPPTTQPEDIEVIIKTNSLTAVFEDENISADVLWNGAIMPEHKVTYAWKVTNADGSYSFQTGDPSFTHFYPEEGVFTVELTASIQVSGIEVAQLHKRAIQVVDDVPDNDDQLRFFISSESLIANEFEYVDFEITDANIGEFSINPMDIDFTWDFGTTGVINNDNNETVSAYFTNGGYPTISVTGTIDIRGHDYSFTQTYPNFRVVDGTEGELYTAINLESGTMTPDVMEEVVFSPYVLLNGDNISDWTELSLDWGFGEGAVPRTAKGPGPHTVHYTTEGEKIVNVFARVTKEEQYFRGIGDLQINVGNKVESDITIKINGCPGNLTPTPNQKYDLTAEIDYDGGYVQAENLKWFRNDNPITDPLNMVGAGDYRVELYSGYGTDAELITIAETSGCATYGSFVHESYIMSYGLEGQCKKDAKYVVITESTYESNELEVRLKLFNPNVPISLSKKETTKEGDYYRTRYEVGLGVFSLNSRPALVEFVKYKQGQVQLIESKSTTVTTYELSGVIQGDKKVNVCTNSSNPLANITQPSYYSYKWSGNSQALSFLNDRFTANPIVTPTNSGLFNYTLEVTDPQTGCKENASVELATGNLSITPNNFSICNGLANELDVEVTGGSGEYQLQWLTTNGLLNSTPTNTHDNTYQSVINPTTTGTSTTPYQLKVTDSKQCTNVFEVSIKSSNPVDLDLEDAYYANCGGIVEITAPNASSYSWVKNDDDFDYSNNRTLVTELPGEFELSVNNGHDCIVKDRTYVEAFKVAGGLNPGHSLYTKELDLSHLGSSFSFHEIGDVDDDGVEDLFIWGKKNNQYVGYVLGMDDFGNVKQTYFVINESLLPSVFKLKGFKIKSLSVLDKSIGGRFRLAITTNLFNDDVNEFVYSTKNAQKVWVSAFNFNRYASNNNQKIQLLSVRRIGSMGGDNEYSLPLASCIVNPTLFEVGPELWDESCARKRYAYHIFGTQYFNMFQSPIGSFNYTTRASQLRLFTSSFLSDDFGKRIVSVPDLDGDGNNELLVSMPGFDEQSDHSYYSAIPEVQVSSFPYRGAIIPADLRSFKKDFGGFYLLFLDNNGSPKGHKKISAKGDYRFNFLGNTNFINAQYGESRELGWLADALVDKRLNDTYLCHVGYEERPHHSIPKQLGKNHLTDLGDVDGDGATDFLTSTNNQIAFRDNFSNYHVISFKNSQPNNVATINFHSDYLNSFSNEMDNMFYQTGSNVSITKIGDIDNDGISELLIDGGKMWSWNSSYGKKWSLDMRQFMTKSSSKIMVARDLNSDGIPDLIEDLGAGKYKIHFLDGIVDEENAFVKKEIDLCGSYMCNFNNKDFPSRAEVIRAGDEFCGNSIIDVSDTRGGGDYVSTAITPTLINYTDACRGNSGSLKMELRATKEMIFKPGVYISANNYSDFDFRAKMFDISALEDCYATAQNAKSVQPTDSWSLNDEVENEEEDNEEQLVLINTFPNPTNDELNIEMSSSEVMNGNLYLTDAMGTVLNVWSINTSNAGYNFSFRNQTSGVYFLKYIDLDTGYSQIEKVMVLH